jgi:hypothetical protein
MRPTNLAFALPLCLGLATSLAAGDPVPDVDVTVEQVPGAGVWVEITPTGPFDRVALGGSKAFIAELEPEHLPPGWVMTRNPRDQGQVALAGPARDTPTRFRLRRSGRTLDKSVDWDVSYAGRSLRAQKGVVPLSRPPFTTRNSLSGIVTLPEKVSPGEALAFQPLAGAALPTGGRFVLSGVVMDTVSDQQLGAARAAVASAGRPLAAPDPRTGPRDLTLDGGSENTCADLAPLAAAIFTQADAGQRKSFYESRSNTARKSYFESRSNTARLVAIDDARRSGHDTTKNAIGNLKALYRVANLSTAGFAIDEKGVKRTGVTSWTVTSAGAATLELAIEAWNPAAEAQPAAWIAFDGRAISPGCVFTPRSLDVADLVDVAEVVARRAGPLPGNGKDTVETRTETPSDRVVGRLPENILPGAAVSLQYIDRFGDLWLDVPAVPGTAVVPAPATEEPPCLRTATVYAQSADLVCVCGNFPTPEAQAGVRIDERPAGAPVSASLRSLEFTLPPHVTALGRHVWSGDPAAGFAASCRAETQLVHVAGEMDSQKLFSGQATPMRLTVTGSEGKVPLSVRNLTPEIIRIDGGDTQTAETSGGTPNQVTRSVSGLVRGNFNVEWSLAVDRCPCE